VVVVRAVEIFGDVHIFDPNLTIVDIAERIDQGGFSLANRLDFRARQHQSGGKRVADGIVKRSATVLYIDLLKFHFCAYLLG
jgi:hypothetical protein